MRRGEIHHTNINHSNKAAQRRSRLELIMKARRAACPLHRSPRPLASISRQALALRHRNGSRARLGLGVARGKAGRGETSAARRALPVGQAVVALPTAARRGRLVNGGCSRWRRQREGPVGAAGVPAPQPMASRLVPRPPAVARWQWPPRRATPSPTLPKGWCEPGGEAGGHGFSILGGCS